MEIELYLTLSSDTANSYASRARVSVDGDDIKIELSDPPRTVSFKLRTMKRAIATLEDGSGE